MLRRHLVTAHLGGVGVTCSSGELMVVSGGRTAEVLGF